MTKLELIALLQRIPGNPVVTTWDGEDASEIEQVITAHNVRDGGTFVCLGLGIAAERFREVELEWAANDSAAEELRRRAS